MMEGFEGQVIVISGATGGFGSLAAHALSSRGARLVLTDREEGPLDQLASSLGTECALVAGDITDPELAKACVATAIDRFGHLDAAFNNAGIEHKLDRVPDITPETVEQVMAVNLNGTLNGMQAQLPAIAARARETGRSGAILNTASIAGVRAAPKLGLYAASKHAIVGLSRSAAVEYARHGVRVNCLCPAFVRTRMVSEGILKDFDDPETGMAKLASGIPMGRIGEPEEVIPAILFALSPSNGFFTGQEIRLDGGMTA
ncbi:glucose 1-dehydrogenase [Rhodobacteraceae bacterium NNCM2]|nr:glucose 1-dehydrogenase [Coraliihabitans acroporae]